MRVRGLEVGEKRAMGDMHKARPTWARYRVQTVVSCSRLGAVRQIAGILSIGWGLALGCTSTDPDPEPTWKPGMVYASPLAANDRGLLDRRGLIHAHSVFSHDACDNEPVKNGVRDPQCFDDFRAGLCQSKQDFVMLTDHSDGFAETTFEQALLHREALGDRWVNRAGAPVASWAACPDGQSTLVLAGFEHGTMSVGLQKHVADTPEARRAIYGSTSSAALQAVAEAGALTLLQHTEDWSVEQITEMPVTGFEMYNLHANAFRAAGNILELVVLATERPEELPHPDLILMTFWSEDPRYLERWGSVLASGTKRVTTMGTDCHRNSFPTLLPDGERGDSYRRMMHWLGNHLLVRPDADGNWDDLSLKEALKAGRLYGVLEFLGSPKGFDYIGQSGTTTVEMGGELALAAAPELRVKMPTVRGLDPTVDAPVTTIRILRAVPGGFEVVASGLTDVTYEPTQPGAYRAEVRMVPKHLRAHLGKYRLAELGDFVWVYSNPIYVR